MQKQPTLPGTRPFCPEIKTAEFSTLADSLVFPLFLGVHKQPWDPSLRRWNLPRASCILLPVPQLFTGHHGSCWWGHTLSTLSEENDGLAQTNKGLPLCWVCQTWPSPALTWPSPPLWFGVLFASIPHLHLLPGSWGMPCGNGPKLLLWGRGQPAGETDRRPPLLGSSTLF